MGEKGGEGVACYRWVRLEGEARMGKGKRLI